jgi:hypothetical protein
MIPKQLYQWVEKTSNQWDAMTRHFRASVVVFSRGVVRTQSSQVRKIAGCAGGQPDSQRRRLQRFLKRPIAMESFFGGWTRSVIAQVKPREVVLIVDETKLTDQWGVMVVGLAYQRRCIPLAWAVYRANCAEDYPDDGQVGLILRLLQAVQTGVPAQCRVRVLADRGIGTSPALMRGIMALNWTFLFRVTRQSKVVLPNGSDVTFYDQVTQPGQIYHASGLVFKKRGRVPAHVRVSWGPDAQDRWALVTNDPTLTGWEYAQRMWIEKAFRDLKSHGWHVEDVSCTCPERLARLWIILVVAYTWMLFIGQALAAQGLTLAPRRRPNGEYVPRWSLFQEGRRAFLCASPPN